MKKLILVNGIPASGKSSVAKVISQYFNIPILSIDEIKEPFMLQFADVIDRTLNRKLGYAAYESMFNIVRDSPEDSVFILDAWFGFRDKSVLLDYLQQSGVERVIEVWNEISPTLVAERYQSRCSKRIKGHPGEEYISELMVLAEKACPMEVGDLYTLNQNQQANNDALISWIKIRLI
ncbi:AAA family ATPase [Izhakiella australiensis]|uniref:AAA family ATPase n=1 Tax=Izhakiella australiensis TaxID=1926881 RepID=A0A1S8YSS4_9GAMM|nr:AAA family ATPase [Izhakiella australiensis]OON42130.1 AAA family ATPase [Izhakiella australiensis]